jgi:hypothetical protein
MMQRPYHDVSVGYLSCTCAFYILRLCWSYVCCTLYVEIKLFLKALAVVSITIGYRLSSMAEN